MVDENKTEIKSILKQPEKVESKKSESSSSKNIDAQSKLVPGMIEAEVAAQITVPNETCWAWVVLFVSFLNICIADGIVYTFAVIAPEMVIDLQTSLTMVLIINSTCVFFYFCFGPVTSALINRYGFRFTTMLGAYISVISIIVTFLTNNYVCIVFSYGFFFGCGSSMVNIASGLIIGFYFEKHRALAFSLANTGTSIGIIFFELLQIYFVKIADWKANILFNGTCFGLVYFMAFAYIPLPCMTIEATTDESESHLTTYLPKMSKEKVSRKPGKISHTKLTESSKPHVSRAEKFFGTPSNTNYPTAATVIRESIIEEPNIDAEAETSKSSKTKSKSRSQLTLVPIVPETGITKNELKQMETVKSRLDKDMQIDATIEKCPVQSKRKWWRKLFIWKPHIEESRPMYRDDAFYSGNIKKLPEYKKAHVDDNNPSCTGIEYQLAVSHVASKQDLKDRRGLCTVALRRVLASMLDAKLLKTKSFMMYSISCFLLYTACLVPLLLIKERNKHAGMSTSYESWYLSTIGFSGIFGRFFFGYLSSKIDPVYSFQLIPLVIGISVILSSLSFTFYYQLAFCTIYGFCMASIGNVRSLFLVHHYGLENLTNATGIIFLFQGIGSLVGPPLVSFLKDYLGLVVSFMVSGIIDLASFGIMLLVQFFLRREIKKKNKERNTHLNRV